MPSSRFKLIRGAGDFQTPPMRREAKMDFPGKVIITVLALLSLCIGDFSYAKSAMKGPIYAIVHGWPEIPDNEMLDEVPAVAVNRRDNVLVLTRAGRKLP